jgi:hypothetical protein
MFQINLTITYQLISWGYLRVRPVFHKILILCHHIWYQLISRLNSWVKLALWCSDMSVIFSARSFYGALVTLFGIEGVDKIWLD